LFRRNNNFRYFILVADTESAILRRKPQSLAELQDQIAAWEMPPIPIEGQPGTDSPFERVQMGEQVTASYRVSDRHTRNALLLAKHVQSNISVLHIAVLTDRLGYVRANDPHSS
jgi:hypothetical protein